MRADDFLGYLYATDQLDEFLGLKRDNIVKCINCDTELLVFDGSTMYCPQCNDLVEYNTHKKIDNKKLTLEQKRILSNKI